MMPIYIPLVGIVSAPPIHRTVNGSDDRILYIIFLLLVLNVTGFVFGLAPY